MEPIMDPPDACCYVRAITLLVHASHASWPWPLSALSWRRAHAHAASEPPGGGFAQQVAARCECAQHGLLSIGLSGAMGLPCRRIGRSQVPYGARWTRCSRA